MSSEAEALGVLLSFNTPLLCRSKVSGVRLSSGLNRKGKFFAYGHGGCKLAIVQGNHFPEVRMLGLKKQLLKGVSCSCSRYQIQYQVHSSQNATLNLDDRPSS